MNGLIELREESPGKLILRGYASVSERWYPVGNMFEEKVNRKTWARGLKEGPDTVLVQDHGGLAYARTKTPSGTPSLLLSETDHGLCVEAFLDATAPRVQDLRSTSENAGLQMSVAFLCSEDRWNKDRSRRELIQASVNKGDVTVCNYGANDAAAATISERGKAGEAERRTYAESLKGSRERRMSPNFDGYDLRDEQLLTVARGHATIAVPPPPIRSYVEQAKAARTKLRRGRADAKPAATSAASSRTGTGRYSVERAKAAKAKARRGHPGSAASVDGEEDRPRYTQAQIDSLGHQGRAFKKRDGTFGWPCADRRDVLNAVRDWTLGRAKPSEATAIKQFIKIRARLLGIERLLPESWQSKAIPKPHPKELERDPADSAPSTAGQEQ
jgi:hypothetical protein